MRQCRRSTPSQEWPTSARISSWFVDAQRGRCSRAGIGSCPYAISAASVARHCSEPHPGVGSRERERDPFGKQMARPLGTDAPSLPHHVDRRLRNVARDTDPRPSSTWDAGNVLKIGG